MPERTCVGCRAKAPQSELVRLVRVGDGVQVDARGVLPGRGAYLHPGRPECAALAAKKRALPRALRATGLDAASCAAAMDAIAVAPAV